MTDVTPEADARLLEKTLFEVKKVIVGQDRLVERLLTALFARGHILLEGVPGVAKTLAAETLATAMGDSFRRIQFTPDLVPSDLLGTRIYRASRESFDVELGPVMANLVLADEINRAPAKVQSALLEVMAEGHLSIGGQTYPTPRPFLVLATQNPIESEGVYQLPEAQRDRFLIRVVVGYPGDREESAIWALLRRDTNGTTARLTVGVLVLDTAEHTVALKRQPLTLTNKEFGVLEYLMTRPGHVVSSEELLEHVWDANADPFTQTVRVTVGTLRRRLGEGSIETVVGRGYRLREEGW